MEIGLWGVGVDFEGRSKDLGIPGIEEIWFLGGHMNAKLELFSFLLLPLSSVSMINEASDLVPTPPAASCLEPTSPASLKFTLLASQPPP